MPSADAVADVAAEAAQVRAVWQRLGLPGLVDVHVHFMPQNVMDKVWAYFDGAGPLLGTSWPIAYRGDEADRLARLRAMGVRCFPSLLYPHKPAMAELAERLGRGVRRGEHDDVLSHRDVLPRADGAERYVARALDGGARLFKAHVQVGAYDPRDPLLDGVWGQLADARRAGRRALRQRAGAGAVHRAGAVRRGAGPPPPADRGDRAHGDAGVRRVPRAGRARTTGCTWTPRWRSPTSPRPLMPFAARAAAACSPTWATGCCSARDFPNTPYPYVHQLDALERLELGDDWLRAVLHDNGARLLGLETT